MRSGVEAPEGAEGTGGARLLLDGLGEEGSGVPIVVVRCILVVSAEGGGGRCCSEDGERTVALQRKHSPVP